jgi:hypothetical protein
VAALERGSGPSSGAGEGEGPQRQHWRGGEAVHSKRGVGQQEARGVGQQEAKKGFRVPNGPWAGLGCAGHQVDRLGQPSRRLVDWKNQVAS